MINKIIELKNASGRKNKISILQKYASDKEFCRLLYYTLNPLLAYNVSESTLRTKDDIEDSRLVFFTNIVSPGDRIAQMIILPFLEVNFIQVNELDSTDRGCGEFGSTGISKKQ